MAFIQENTEACAQPKTVILAIVTCLLKGRHAVKYSVGPRPAHTARCCWTSSQQQGLHAYIAAEGMPPACQLSSAGSPLGLEAVTLTPRRQPTCCPGDAFQKG